MDCDILRKKNYYTRPDGVKLTDLTQSSIKDQGAVTSEKYVLVTEPFAMRPDKIALSEYADDNKFDYILKYNGVSNPLSVYPGQILLIPDEEQMSKQIMIPTSQNKPSNTQNADNPKEADFNEARNAADKKRADYLKNKFKLDSLTPPNINEAGEENIAFVDGKIILGASVTSKDVACPEQYTRARLKQQLLAKNMFKI